MRKTQRFLLLASKLIVLPLALYLGLYSVRNSSHPGVGHIKSRFFPTEAEVVIFGPAARVEALLVGRVVYLYADESAGR